MAFVEQKVLISLNRIQEGIKKEFDTIIIDRKTMMIRIISDDANEIKKIREKIRECL